ncbi:hypothetical protein [Kineosporia babensis]|uniref:Uncharacterized protein n=1 Tax=Kineosporia babensis TaxID=499548 RepID=A0A9X1ND74_9ACTN|nr:hypothetical protein [Kineosporia babensis]MCD5310878.1 hypothetical protein [Kineosporia babensis]
MSETTEVEAHASVAGVRVFWSDLVSSRGWDLNDGYMFDRRSEGLASWDTKAQASEAAKALGWPLRTVQKGMWVSPLIRRRLWVLHCPGGGFVSESGYGRLKAATHRTYVYDIAAPGIAASGWSRRTRNAARQRDIKWGCLDCGSNGYGQRNDRKAARVAGEQHQASMAATH